MLYVQNINIKLVLVFYYSQNCRFLFIYQSVSFSDGTVFMNVALLTFRLTNFNCQKVLPPRNSLKARTLYYILNLYSLLLWRNTITWLCWNLQGCNATTGFVNSSVTSYVSHSSKFLSIITLIFKSNQTKKQLTLYI